MPDERQMKIVSKRYASLAEMLADMPPTPWHERAFRAAYRKVRDGIWWLRHRLDPRHRYHVVRTGLRPGYHDADARLEAAMITLFKDFIERRRPFEHFDTENSPNAAEWAEVGDLYEYFRDYDVNRPPAARAFDRDCDAGDHEAIMAQWRESERLTDELTEKLARLVALRHHFWT